MNSKDYKMLEINSIFLCISAMKSPRARLKQVLFGLMKGKDWVMTVIQSKSLNLVRLIYLANNMLILKTQKRAILRNGSV